MNGRLIYRCTPSIVWVRDAGQILLVEEETGRSWALQGLEAVVWDLLAVGYSVRRIVLLLSLIFSFPAAEAEQALAGVLQTWRETNIVQVFVEANDGELDHQCSL